MQSVFVLHHVYEREGTEEAKLIGVFSTEDAAHRAIERLRDKEGFRDHQEGFCVAAYELDRIWWSDGFVTVA